MLSTVIYRQHQFLLIPCSQFNTLPLNLLFVQKKNKVSYQNPKKKDEAMNTFGKALELLETKQFQDAKDILEELLKKIQRMLTSFIILVCAILN